MGGRGLPAQLQEILRRDGIPVEDAPFHGGLSADETLRRFDKQYGGMTSAGEPQAYALKVADSPSSRLAQGTPVRMVHVPRVRNAFEGVAPAPGTSDPPGQVPPADMFVFFHAETGRHIETTYIASEE